MEKEIIIDIVKSALIKVKQARLDLDKNYVIRANNNLQSIHDILVSLARKVDSESENN
ncbi:unnamed protein product [marine sediment metagenome]|uniref:Uncharacterized protein n=1 Tax=marine sediment metagenome TaxID=412755 RepID=X1C3T0_9ZZZZ